MAVLIDRKTRLFAGLDLLENDTFDSKAETCKASVMLRKGDPRRSNTSNNTKNVLRRSHSDNIQPMASPFQIKPIVTKSNSSLSFQETKTDQCHLHSSESSLSFKNDALNTPGRKRKVKEPPKEPLSTNVPRKRLKREETFSMQPESRQWFKGLRFFYLPNTDTPPLQRRRINRAISYGALWEVKWSEKVDFLIADDDYTYESALAELGLEHFQESLNVVNNTYVADCIEWGSKLDPRHRGFRILNDPRNDNAQTQHMAQRAKVPENQESHRLKTWISHTLFHSKPGEVTASSSRVLTTKSRASRQPAKPLSAQSEIDLTISHLKKLTSMELHVESDEEEVFQDMIVLDDTSGNGERIATEKFACSQPHTESSRGSNPNDTTISILEALGNHYDSIGDNWRSFAYRRVVGILRRQRHQICTEEQARKIPGIGGRTARKIEEIVTTNNLQLLDTIEKDSQSRSLGIFTKIHGVGHAQARIWVSKGYRQLSDLPRGELSDAQKIGLDRYDDFNLRIPRSEVERHATAVQKAAKAIDPNLVTEAMGSYRRGQEESGDIDIMITHSSHSLSSLRSILIHELLPALTNSGYIVGTLSAPAESHGSTWRGACRMPDSLVWRRLDILLVPDAEIGAARIYFTGNEIFNRSLRLLARKRGMRLNQRGLYKNVLRSDDAKKMTDGELLEGKDERKIFELLGVSWREPTERNV